MALTEEIKDLTTRSPIVTDGIVHGAVLTVPSQEKVATVRAWPEGVQVKIHKRDGELTLDEAIALHSLLKAAIDQAPKLDYDANEGIGKLIERGA